MVQVRQKVDHKRTFLYLEQLILKHRADKDTISVAEVKDGLNFFYGSKQHALKMVDFLSAIAPVKYPLALLPSIPLDAKLTLLSPQVEDV